jgi:NADPH:quinone reductase
LRIAQDHYVAFSLSKPQRASEELALRHNKNGTRMQVIQIEQHGGVEQLHVIEAANPDLLDDHVIVRAAYAGLNFVDIYQREGRYPGLTLPLRLGIEGSGVILQAPSGSEWQVGDRVAYTTGVQGSYAQWLSVPQASLIRVPNHISLKTACAALEHGLTASVLCLDVARITAQSSVLVHAAAGGVGGFLVQRLRGQVAQIFGTVSSSEKADWLVSLGVTPLRYDNNDDWPEQLLQVTRGNGVDIIFDSVGQATFDHSVQALARCGHLILFGAASGQPAAISPLTLMAKSLTLSRPVMPHYVVDQVRLRARADDLFDRIAHGALQARVHATFGLTQAQEAQELLASRRTMGKVLLEIDGTLH